MGLGKTGIALEVLVRLRDSLDGDRVLVVAPLRPAYSVWPVEAAKWDQFRSLRVRVLHGEGRSEQVLREPADVYVINPEGLPWLAAQNWIWPDLLIVDESTKFKRRSAKRSRILGRLLRHFRRRYILTGTPAPNGLIDLHGQAYILDEGAALGRTMTEYRERYFVPVPSGAGHWDWRLRRGAEKEIYAALGPLVVRLDARDHLDLPSLVTVERRVKLPPPARALYDQLKKEMVVALESGTAVASNAGALTAKCRQVANGVLYLTEGAPSEVVHREKAKAVADLVEELGGRPLLVAYEHRCELPLLRAALGPAPHIGGGVSAMEGARLEREWNAGRLRVLLVHPSSVGHGLNLQSGGHHIAWFSMPWDLELYDQLIGRIWRQGQRAERVVVHQVVAEGTIDETIARTLKRKKRDQQDLLDALGADLRLGGSR